MIDAIGGATSELVGLALDASLLSHAVSANNLANRSTVGYVPKRVSFESQLMAYMPNIGGGERLSSADVEAMRTHMADSSTLIVDEQGPVELDRELLSMTENALRYQALLHANGLRGEIMRMAVKEGRG